MWETAHLCLSSHDEVMFRSQEDLNYGFNCFAMAVIQTESRALCESFLTTHYHAGVQSYEPKTVMHLTRNAYARYFNTKYERRGRLGEKVYFVTPLKGINRMLVAVNYILRQALHHGLTSTPFEYNNCSINALFKKELGKSTSVELMPDELKYLHMPSNYKIEDKYRMDASGLLLREDIIDCAYMESLYVTPRNFLFQMNAKSSEEWKNEQLREDSSCPVITMETIEPWADTSEIVRMYKNENGRPDLSAMTDLELCDIIDNQYVPRYSRSAGATIYTLSSRQRADIGNELYCKYKYGGASTKQGKYTTEKQIKRCAAIGLVTE